MDCTLQGSTYGTIGMPVPSRVLPLLTTGCQFSRQPRALAKLPTWENGVKKENKNKIMKEYNFQMTETTFQHVNCPLHCSFLPMVPIFLPMMPLALPMVPMASLAADTARVQDSINGVIGMLMPSRVLPRQGYRIPIFCWFRPIFSL